MLVVDGYMVCCYKDRCLELLVVCKFGGGCDL